MTQGELEAAADRGALAAIADRCGEHAGAVELLGRSLTIRRRVLGDGYVAVQRTAAVLARALRDCEDRTS